AFVSRRLGLVEIREGEPRPADLALNASEWIARWAADQNGGFNESLARKELGRQLGDVWRGLDHAAPHIRCLLAVFALHGTGQCGEALKLLGDLSDSLAKADKEGAAGPNAPLAFPGALVARVDKQLADPEVRGDILKTMARHGFTTPGLMSVLIEVRAWRRLERGIIGQPNAPLASLCRPRRLTAQLRRFAQRQVVSGIRASG